MSPTNTAASHPGAPWADDPSRRPASFEAFPAVAVETSLWARFEEVAARFADQPALVGTERTLTFAQVGREARRGAALVAGHSPDRAVPVALLFDHDVDLVLAVLATLAAGMAVLILDPDAPDSVNAAILADAGPALLLHGAGRGEQARRLAAGFPIDDWTVRPPDGDVMAPLPAVAAGDPAMFAYTSGTTSAPKAAVLSHRALLHLVRGATNALAISPTDRLPMLFPAAMAVAAYPMFLPLLNGGALCVFDMRSLGLAPFPAWLAEQGVSVIYMSPTVARFMGDTGPAREYPKLRLVVLGGERVDDEALAIVSRQFGDHVVLANGYGTTETGVLTFCFVEPGRRHGPAGVPVGQPIPGVELTIRSAEGGPVGPDQPGELTVTSPFLFSGYWNRPDDTARVLTAEAGSDMATYCTGDLGQLDASGSLTLLGRSDTQVKVRGHRVVPGEVEQALLALECVMDAVVEARPDADSTNRLVAWVVPVADPDEPATSSSIRAALAATVKAHLVPADIILIDELPLLPNGKLDRRALTQRQSDVVRDPSSIEPPRTATEELLVALWSKVLNVASVGTTDSFADLGGQSLDLVRVVVLLEEDHGVQLPMASLLDVRTIQDLAPLVEAQQHAEGRRSTVALVQAGDSGRPPLFFVHDLYGTAFVLRFLGPLLGTDQPLYGFESPLLRGPRSPYHSLESLAMRYVADLREVQPEGPYHLAGYSFGGVLAFEMARQLEADGQEVRFLGVIDVGPGYRGRHYDPRKVLDKPWLSVPYPPTPDSSRREKVRFYRDLVRGDPITAVEHVLLRTGLDRWTDPLQFWLDVRRHGQIHPGRRIWYAWRGHWELARAYDWAGRTYGGRITLFWADESASTDGSMGWAAIAPNGVDVVRVPTGHETMLEPEGAPVIAPLVRQALDAAIATAGDPSAG